MFDTHCWYAYHQQNVINWTVNQQYGYALGQVLVWQHIFIYKWGTIRITKILRVLPLSNNLMDKEYASYVRRFMAELIDFIFAFLIKLLVVYSLVELEFMYVLFKASCISHGISGLRFGCTPGKYLLGIRVIGCISVASISGGSPEYIQVTGPITVPFK
uniref:RDD domain-containing protein n=1 Tax=Heterorhabditis bacteriophora TaxID=37862 RepID=A0A1I7WSE6_HETBA